MIHFNSKNTFYFNGKLYHSFLPTSGLFCKDSTLIINCPYSTNRQLTSWSLGRIVDCNLDTEMQCSRWAIMLCDVIQEL